MKILSNISGVGRRLCRLIMAIVVVVCLNSCCSILYLPFDDGKYAADITTETGSVRVINRFRNVFFLRFELKGEYTINPDSLKLWRDDTREYLRDVYFTTSGQIGIKNDTLVKDCYVGVTYGDRKDRKSAVPGRPPMLYILPSDFIMCNGKRVLNDTLRSKMWYKAIYKKGSK